MSVIFRPYQLNSISDIKDYFRKGAKRVVLCKPTGAGKTLTFSELARQTVAKGGTVIIATHRKELLDQAGKALFKMGLTYERINSKTRKVPYSRVYVAMIKTLVSRKNKPQYRELMSRATLIIADECHLGDLRPVHSLFEGKHIVGVTATPISAKKSEPLNLHYQEIIVPVQTSELIESGYLVPARLAAVDIDRSQLKTVAGEYTDESQLKALKVSKLYDGVVEKYLKLASGRRAMCFNVNVEHSKETRDKFLAAGISCEHVDGETDDDERSNIFARFANNEFQVLCNVGIATAGFDDPEVSCIIFNRATKSLPLWLQCLGRGSRLFPGKKDFVIIDMASNYKELGLWQSDRNWYEMFHNPKAPGEGVAPSKMCPGKTPEGDYCECIIPASAQVCEYCGYVYPEIEKRSLNLDFAWIDENAAIKLAKPKKDTWRDIPTDKLAEYVTSGTYAPSWAKYVIFDRSETEEEAVRELEIFGAGMNYKPGWSTYHVKSFLSWKEDKRQTA